MSLPHAIMWGVVLAVGIPAAWWNPTAGALVLCWALGEAIYWITGNSLPTTFLLAGDFIVIMVVFAKAEHHRPFLPFGKQLLGILRDGSPCMDRVVLLIIPVLWVLYAAPLHPYYKWWGLWILAIAQFAAVGWESLHPHPCDYAQVGDREDTRLMCQAANDSS